MSKWDLCFSWQFSRRVDCALHTWHFLWLKPILLSSNTSSGQYRAFFPWPSVFPVPIFISNFKHCFWLCSIYIHCSTHHCCHSHRLIMKLRIKIFLFQWKCILSLLIYHILIGTSALPATHISFSCLYSFLVYANYKLLLKRDFPTVQSMIICDFCRCWVKPLSLSGKTVT